MTNNDDKTSHAPCDKHVDCMERIHTAINDIKQTNARSAGVMEGFSKSVSEFLEAIRKDVYAPGGIVEKVGNHSSQLTLQWGMISAIIVAVIISFFRK